MDTNLVVLIFFLSLYGFYKRRRLSLILNKRFNWRKLSLSLLGTISLFLALMDLKSESEETIKSKLPIHFLLDISRSMLVDDLKPNRLTIAKNIIRDIIENVNRDVAITVFSNEAYSFLPESSDLDLALQFLDSIDDQYIASGATDISSALKLAREDGKSKVVILFTDGEDRFRRAKKYVDSNTFFVALGTKKGGYIPTKDGFVKDSNGNLVTSVVDREYLASLGRVYSPVGLGRDSGKLLSDISLLLEKSDKEIKVYRRYYQIFLFIAIILLTLGYFDRSILFILLISCSVDDAADLFNSGRYEEALKIYESIGAKEQVANCNIKLGNISEAKEYYRDRIKSSEDAKFIWEYLMNLVKDKSDQDDRDQNEENNREESREESKEESRKESKEESNKNKSGEENSKEDNREQNKESNREESREESKKESNKNKSGEENSKEDNREQNKEQNKESNREESREESNENKIGEENNIEDNREQNKDNNSIEDNSKENSEEQDTKGSNKDTNESSNESRQNSKKEVEYDKDVEDAISIIEKIIERDMREVGRANMPKYLKRESGGW